MPKKRVLEELIRERAQQLEAQTAGNDVWTETVGAWKRREKPETSVRNARKAFRSAMARHREP